jgi:hypothetical protein
MLVLEALRRGRRNRRHRHTLQHSPYFGRADLLVGLQKCARRGDSEFLLDRFFPPSLGKHGKIDYMLHILKEFVAVPHSSINGVADDGSRP